MLSKMVTDRVKAKDSVLASLAHLGPKVASQGEALLSPYLKKGETVPDLGLLATLVERMLGDHASAMEKADSAHNDELADDAEPRQKRDEAARALYAALVAVKQGTVTLFGEAWVSKLKLPAEIPADPAALRRLADDVVQALETAKLPKPVLAGVASFDRQPWIANISAPAKALTKALKDVTREQREAEATLIEKTRAIAAYDRAFAKGVAVGAALLRMVGEEEHADGLRPSASRPGTLEEATPVVVEGDAPTPS